MRARLGGPYRWLGITLGRLPRAAPGSIPAIPRLTVGKPRRLLVAKARLKVRFVADDYAVVLGLNFG